MAQKTTAWTIAGLIFIALFVVGLLQLPSNKQKQTSQDKSLTFGKNTIIPTKQKKQSIKIFLVALAGNSKTFESGTKIGCGDSLVAIDREIPLIKSVLVSSLTELFSIKDKNYGKSGFYNSLYNSNLKVDSAKIENGKATVYISGTFLLGGVCDNPRFEEQIKATVMQFSTIKTTDIFINNKPLHDSVSEK